MSRCTKPALCTASMATSVLCATVRTCSTSSSAGDLSARPQAPLQQQGRCRQGAARRRRVRAPTVARSKQALGCSLRASTRLLPSSCGEGELSGDRGAGWEARAGRHRLAQQQTPRRAAGGMEVRVTDAPRTRWARAGHTPPPAACSARSGAAHLHHDVEALVIGAAVDDPAHLRAGLQSPEHLRGGGARIEARRARTPRAQLRPGPGRTLNSPLTDLRSLRFSILTAYCAAPRARQQGVGSGPASGRCARGAPAAHPLIAVPDRDVPDLVHLGELALPKLALHGILLAAPDAGAPAKDAHRRAAC
jgi:hypothetical protein